MVQEVVRKKWRRVVQDDLVYEAVHGVVKVWFVGVA